MLGLASDHGAAPSKLYTEYINLQSYFLCLPRNIIRSVPASGKRQVHNQVSIQAYYTFELIDQYRDSAPFSFEDIELLSSKARRFHIDQLLKHI